MKKWKVLMAMIMVTFMGWGITRLYFPDAVIQAFGEDKAKVEIQTEDRKKVSAQVVTVETVQKQTFARKTSLTGAVTPTRIARLASPGEGPVQACARKTCMVREGDRVKKGDHLLQISRSKAALAEVSAASQALKEQEEELGRITQLVEGGAVPGAQLESARSRYENAKAQLARAEQSAADYLLTAPWNGIVSRVFVTEGDYVAPRTPLIEIFDPDSLVVQFAVPETQSTQVRNAMPVEVQLDAHPGKTFSGTITRVYPNLDDQTRTRTVEATLSESISLLPGMFARIQVVMDRIPDALTVPAHCLVPGPSGGYSVFVVEDGKARQREVTTGLEIDGRVHVVAGLHAGDTVIVAGHQKLKNGVPVKAEPKMNHDPAGNSDPEASPDPFSNEQSGGTHS